MDAIINFFSSIADTVQGWLATMFDGGIKDFIDGIFDAIKGIFS